MAVNRIKHSSLAPFANDRQLDRVQNLGVSGRLDSEDISEIGNLDIVEVVDNPPSVDITLDTNQYGSVKTYGTLAEKNFDWATVTAHKTDATTVTVKAGDYYIGEMKYTISADVTKTFEKLSGTAGQKRIDVISLATSGANDAAKVVVTAGTPTSSALTGADIPATPAGNLKIAEVEVTVNEDADGIVPLTDLDVVNRGALRTFYLKDFETAAVDLVVPVKEAGDNTDVTNPISRTMLVENAFVNRYDASFSVNGLATENFSLESDNKTWFLGNEKDLWVDRFNAAGTEVTLTYTPTLRPNGKYTVKVRKYNKTTGAYTNMTEDADPTTGFSVNPTTKALTLETALTLNDTLIVRYPSAEVPAAAQQFFRRVPSAVSASPVIAGGLKQGQVEVFLSDDLSNRVLRLQSVTISTSLTREPLYEIGAVRAYERPLTFPIPITINIEATASDLKEFARLCGKAAEYEAGTLGEVAITDFVKNLDMYVRIYRYNNEVRAKAPFVAKQMLKQIKVSSLSMTDENTEIRVQQNGTQTWGMKANTQLEVQAYI